LVWESDLKDWIKEWQDEARGGVRERLHGPPLHSASATSSERLLGRGVWRSGGQSGCLSDERSGLIAAKPDAPKLGAARRLAGAAASARAVAVALAGLVVEMAAAGVEAASVGERWSRQRSRQH